MFSRVGQIMCSLGWVRSCVHWGGSDHVFSRVGQIMCSVGWVRSCVQ